MAEPIARAIERIRTQIWRSRFQWNPKEYRRRLVLIAWHHICRGALLGLNLRLDPDLKPRHRLALAAAIMLACAMFIADNQLAIALAWLVFSPIWLYVFAEVYDEVMENRSYISLLGVAALAAWAAERSPYAVGLLIVALAARTIVRNRDWSTPFRFWRRALQESPGKLRCQLNFTEQIEIVGRVGEKKEEPLQINPTLETTIESYRAIIEKGDDMIAGTAAGNLAALLEKLGRLDEATALYNLAGNRWPTHPLINHNRGTYFMGYGMYAQALFEFSKVYGGDQWPVLLRNQARCCYHLGQKDQARFLYIRAFEIDGKRIILPDLLEAGERMSA